MWFHLDQVNTVASLPSASIHQNLYYRLTFDWTSLSQVNRVLEIKRCQKSLHDFIKSIYSYLQQGHMTTGVCDQNYSKRERIEKKISGRADSIWLMFCIRDCCISIVPRLSMTFPRFIFNSAFLIFLRWNLIWKLLSVNTNIQLFQNIRVFIEANAWKVSMKINKWFLSYKHRKPPVFCWQTSFSCQQNH